MKEINLEKDDLAILVKPDGTSEVFLPFRKGGENELTPEQLIKMLKEIRNVEQAFTEIVNEAYVPETKEEKDLYGE